MKIAIWHNLPSGGASRALHQHIKGLAERGHYIEVWTSSLADSQFLDVDSYVAKTHIIPLSIATRVRIDYLDDIRSLAYQNSTRVKRMLAFCQQCAQQIEAGQFDVLFANSCHYFNMPFIGRFIKSIPKVLYLGEPNRSLYEAYPEQNWAAPPCWPKYWYSLSYYKYVWRDTIRTHRARVLVREEVANYQSYTKVLVNSFYSNESLLRAYGGGGDVCYLGIDMDMFSFMDLPREPFVMGLGSFHPPKQPDLAIKALAQIDAAERPKLVWVGNIGNQDYLSQLITLSDQLGVVFEPRQYVPHQELLQLLNTASCLLYTSALEPFGLAPLEANACGLPVVAVGEGGVRETINDGYNGLLTSRRPSEIAEAVLRILTNRNLFEGLSSNGRQMVADRWGIDQAIDRIEQALLSVASTAKRPGRTTSFAVPKSESSSVP
ncbi:glycosyltransferase family 4 protein [Spirosoma sp. SC4-14]|uniref:glycosyltransferase family 4 protein n=1 Tax=Spirosoma sp. SC4-14 TaxID=3128900 RepID=UPI0030CCA183